MILNLESGISYLCSGIFKAPSDKWIHMSRSQDSYEVFYVTEGTLYISSDDEKYVVAENEFLIMPPCRNQHGYKASYCKFYYFHFYKKDGGCEVPVKGTYNKEAVIEQYLSMFSYEKERKNICDHLMAIVILELMQSSHQKSIPGNICDNVLSYIKYAPSEQLSVSGIAGVFNYHEKYLSQKLKKETGIGLKKYIKDEIIKRACHELIYTNKKLEELSSQFGYQDAHSFSHIFKNSMGISPQKYRIKMSVNNTKV